MKVRIPISSVLLCLPCLAPAQYRGPDVAPNVTTVMAAIKAMDETQATLEGNLVRKINHDSYEFEDGTGSMRVEIDDEDLPIGRPIDESTKVRLIGKVDKGLIAVEIDVKRVEIAD